MPSVANTPFPGRQGGNVGKTAERGGGLKQHNLVPALRGGEGGFAPGGSAADDNDGLRRVGLRHGVVILISGARVQGAGDGAAFVEHPGAAFVAADAGQDLVVAAFRELGGQEGIGEQGPAHGHQIGLAGSDDVFGGLAVADPAHHGDGYAGADGPLDRGGAIGVPAVRHAGGGNDVFHGLTDADGDVQHVHAVVGHDLGDADGLFHVDAAGHEFFHAVAEKDGEIGADLFSDGAQDFEREAHPVFKAAAVGILAEVGEMRDMNWFDAGSRCAPWISTASNPASTARQGGLVHTPPTMPSMSSASMTGDGVFGAQATPGIMATSRRGQHGGWAGCAKRPPCWS